MKPRVGVSACLLGAPVRYDGQSKPDEWIRRVLASVADLVPLCPETGAGLPVPRPPVRLVKLRGGIRALGIEDPQRDITGIVEQWSQSMREVLDGLDAVILKSRSPSCGLGSALLQLPNGESLGLTSGLFASFLSAEYPDLVLIEETALVSPRAREHFLRTLRPG